MVRPPLTPGDPERPAEPEGSTGRAKAAAQKARRVTRALAIDRRPLKVSRDYRRLWFAEMVSQAGHQITVVAVFFQVYDLTRSAAKVGFVGLVQLVPMMLAAVFGGPMIDRFDRRRILIATQIGFVVVSSALWMNARSETPSLMVIYVAVAFGAALSGVASPTRGSIVPNLIPVELLASAVALNQVMWNTAQIVGPAIGGIIIARWSVSAAYGIDVITYAATIAVAIALPAQRPKREDPDAPTGIGAVTEAWRFLRGRKELQATFVVDLVAMIFGMPRALFPILAVIRFNAGPEIVGTMFSAIAVGAVFGALTSGWVTKIERQGLAVLIAVAAWGVMIAGFGLTAWLPLALVLLAGAGMADVISAVFRGAILQSTVTDAMRGRLSAIHFLVVAGGPRLGDFEAGLVASAFSPTISVVSGGLICVGGVFVVAAFFRSFATYRAPRPT